MLTALDARRLQEDAIENFYIANYAELVNVSIPKAAREMHGNIRIESRLLRDIEIEKLESFGFLCSRIGSCYKISWIEEDGV